MIINSMVSKIGGGSSGESFLVGFDHVYDDFTAVYINDGGYPSYTNEGAEYPAGTLVLGESTQVEEMTITCDLSGNEVSYEILDNAKFVFVMPNENVTIVC